MAENRVGSIVIDARMDKKDFMTNSRDVSRAISSLKSTVAQTGKNINSSVASYGTAFRQTSKAVKEYNQAIQEIGASMDNLRQKTAQVKNAADTFRELQTRIEASKAEIEKVAMQMAMLEANGGKINDAWQKNQDSIAETSAELERLQHLYKEYAAAYEYAEKRVTTGKDEYGHPLTQEEKNTYDQEADAYANLANEVSDKAEEISEALQMLNKEQDELIAQGKNLPSEEWRQLQREVEKGTENVAKMQEALESMRNRGFENADQSPEYEQEMEKLRELEDAFDRIKREKEEALKPPYMQSWEKMVTFTGLLSEGFGRVQNAASGTLYALTHPVDTLNRALGAVVSGVSRAVSALGKMAGNAAISFIKRLASEARNAAVQLAKLAANAVSSGLKKIATWAGMAAKSMLTFNRANKSNNGGLKTSLKTILKYAFGVRSMFFLFRRLRTAVSDGFGELSKRSPEVKAAMDSLSKASSALKGSLASAFAPILTAIAPALTTLINMLATAINTIGAFFAALTGKNTVAKSIGKIGSAAGKASGKAKELKRQLAGFDELNILDSDKDSGGGGGGGSGSGYSYETENIASNIKDFADRIKALWAAGDYEGIGHEIAGFINRAFAKAEEFITWNNLEKKIQKGLDAVVGVFNGLVDPAKGINFYRIGSTVAAGIDSLLHIFNRLLDPKDGLNIEGAGRAFARALNGLFNNASMWQQAGRLLTNWIRAYIRFSDAFLQEFNEGKVASGIRTALEQIPWADIASETWNTIKLAFNKAGNFLNVLLGGTDFGATAGNDAKAQIEQMAAGFTPMIADSASYDGVWDELAVNLGKAFDSMVKKLTGIIEDVPVEDAVQAVLNWLQRIRDNALADGSVGTLFGTIFKKAFGAFATVVTDFKKNASANGNLIAKAINAAVKAAFSGDENPGTVITDLITGAFDFVKALLEGFNAEEAADELKDAVEDIKWGEIAQAAWDAFKLAVSKLGSFLTVLFGGDVTPEVPDTIETRAQIQGGSFTQQMAEGYQKKPLNFSAEGLADTISDLVSTALTKLDEWIGKIPWAKWGEDINTFLTNLDWAGWGQKLAEALKDLLTNIDDLISASIYGENYQENDTWRTLHKTKAAKYDAEKLLGDSPNAQKVLSSHGLTLEQFTEKQKLANGDPDNAPNGVLAKAMIDAQAEISALRHEINVADAPSIAKQLIDSGESLPVVIAAMEDLGLSDEELSSAINEAQGATVDNTVANESNTTAIDANTTETASAPEQPENPDPTGDLLKYGLEKLEGIIGPWETTYGSQEEMDAAFAEVFEMGDKLETLSQSIDQNNPSGGQSKTTEDSIKVEKQQTKEEKKLTKALKNGVTADGDINLNYKGENVDLLDKDKTPTVTAQVKFVPEGEEPTDDNTNGGLLGWLQALLDADTLEAKIALLKEGWESVKSWLGIDDNTPFSVFIELLKQKWDTIRSFLGIPENGVIDTIVKALLNKDWPGILQALGLPEDATVGAVIKAVMEQGWQGVAALFGLGDGNILEVVGKLLSNPARGSSTLGTVFGTLLEVAGKLLKNPAGGSYTIANVFGTVLSLVAKLTGKDGSGYQSLGAVFGTVLGFVGKLTGKDTSGTFKSLGDVFGTILGVKSGLTGTTNGGRNWFTTLGGLFGAAFGVKSGLTGTTNGGNGWLTTLGALFGTTFGVKAGLNKTPQEGSPKVVDVFGSSFNTSPNLTKDNANWSGGLTKWFADNGGVLSLVANATTVGANWKSKGLTEWFASTNGGTLSLIANATTVGANWKSKGLTEWFASTKGGVLSLIANATTVGANWKSKGLTGWFAGTKGGELELVADITKSGANWYKKGGVADWIGKTATFIANLTNSGSNWSNGLLKWITGDPKGIIGLTINFAAKAGDALKAALKLLGINLATGGVIDASGTLTRFANGGSIMNSGRASWWDGVNKYASGTTRPHGTVFVAGEAGPEIMGHVNGKTEILNKSQLADAIYGAVVSGMANAVNALGTYIAGHMTNCTNAIVSTIGATAELSTVRGLDYYAPAMATGGVMPYDVSAQIARSTAALQGTLDANNEDLIQAMVSAIGNASLTIVNAIQAQMRGIGGGNNVTAQQLINEINRQSMMYGRTPIQGV